MENELNLLRVPFTDETSIQQQQPKQDEHVDIDTYLSSSSTSLSAIDDEHKQETLETPVTTIKKKRTKWHVYDTIATFLLKNRFYLTALEFYTELLENGYDLPRLREYFSNPANFEGSSSTSITKQSSYIRNLNHFADDSVSLGGGGGGGNGDYLFRTSSSQTFDSTSIDNITRYSEDIDWNNGHGSGGGIPSGIGELRFNDERVAVLEFELRKARDTIQELRHTLTYDSADEQQQQHNNKKTEERNGKYQVHSYSSNSIQPIIPSGLTVRPFERRALNYLINEYLLTNNYKLTSVTFEEENDASDLEDWDSVGLNCGRPPDLNQLYRWYCHQLCVEDEKPIKEDFSMFINFDENLHKEYKSLKTTVEKMEFDSIEYNKRINQIEKEKLNLNEEINSLEHEKKNLLIQLQLLQNRFTPDEPSSNEIKLENTIQFNSTRHIPEIYQRAFKRQLLSYHINDDKQDEENPDDEQKTFDDILHELNTLSLDQKDLLDLIVRTITKINLHLNGSKKLDLVPLIIYTSILHPKTEERDCLLKTLFNLYKKPSHNQRQVLLHACLCFAKQSGPLRVHAELLPQCWENINNKLDERRCLVAEACGLLTPHLPKDIRVSLIFSMLQQMLVEDKCDLVRCVCCKSLAMVINEIDDESRLTQCIELLDRCLSDSSDVVQSAKRYLLPSIAIWCLELNKICHILIEHYLIKLESLVQHIQIPISIDNHRFIQLIYLLTDLIVFIFASTLKSMTIVNYLSQPTSLTRTLPDATSSEFYQLHTILSPDSEKLLNHYDQCAIHGEFPFTDQIRTYVDDFLKRSFNTMAFIDIMNGKLVHACSEFIKMFSRYFGRNFWKLKIKPLYVTTNSPTHQDENQHKEGPFVLYATGVLCSWTTEQERAELTQYIYDALLLIANQKLSINTLHAIYAEIGSDINFQENLLNILRDSLTNTNFQVRLYTLQLFNITLALVEHSIISQKILPALITLASDDDINVRTATIPVFGSIITQCSEPEVLERVYVQFQMFDSDTTFRDEHRVQSEFIKTFTQIAPHAESKFREDFILPFLALIASQNSQQQSDRGQAKRLEIATYLFEAYSALSCCFHSGQSILNSFLPGLYCLRVDFAQLRPDSVAVLDSIIKDLEHKLEQHRQDSSLLIGGTNLNQENIRGRMLKGLTNFRDSTEKLTYRFMKKNRNEYILSFDDQITKTLFLFNNANMT